MGCLFELFGDLIVDGYVWLMCLIIPKEKIGKKTRFVLELLVEGLSILLLLCMVFGIIECFEDDPFERQMGRYMVWVPVGIIVLQIGLGIIVRKIRKDKGK